MTHSNPPVRVSHVPEKPPAFVPKLPQQQSPWTTGFGTPESLMEMEMTRREAWGNKMTAELGTRFLFNRLAADLKESLQLHLVNFNGSVFIQYETMSY
ncbi:hypothetical protein HDU98_008006, partial [Podochytrium sp. JEL0797]